MTHAVGVAGTVRADLHLPIATVRVIALTMAEPFDRLFQDSKSIRLDLCPVARLPNSRLCFSKRWTSDRFARLGSLFVLPPGEPARIRSDIGQTASIVCDLFPDHVREWLGEDIQWTNRRVEVSADVACQTIERLMIQLGKEALHPGFASHLLSEALVSQLVVEVARYYQDVPDADTVGGLASWRLRLIDERLRDLQEPATLAELAAMCRLSVRQLTRGYRISRGTTIGEWAARSRMEEAKHRLAMGENTKAIAHCLGFASTSSFCYAFRKATGKAPRRFLQDILPVQTKPRRS